MPRSFITNIDDANAELVRVDALLETANTRVTTLEAEVAAAKKAHEDALAVLRAEHESATSTLTATHATEVTNLKTKHATEMAAAAAETQKKLAQANLTTTPPKVATTEQPTLTGLQRAIAGNTALQTAKS